MTQQYIIDYLKSKKNEFRQKYGITTLGLYGGYARNEAKESSDVDIFYDSNETFSMGFLEFSKFHDFKKYLCDAIILSTTRIFRH